MAIRARVLHFVLWCLVGTLLVWYTSYYSGQVVHYHVELLKNGSGPTYAKLLAYSSAKGNTSTVQSDTQTEVLNRAGANRSSISNIQRIPGRLVDSGDERAEDNEVEKKDSGVKDVKTDKSNKNEVNNEVLGWPSQVSAKVDKPKPSNKTTEKVDKTASGVITRKIYESGHDIPNPELCPDLGSNLRVVIGVISAPNHQDARMAIRQTWGHYAQRKDIALGFVIGTSKVPSLNEITFQESTTYGDIIRANFIDSYDNLTLKTISLLEWVDNYCSKAHFILKTDDDMFINFQKLLLFIDKHWQTRNTIFGRLARKWKPIRNKKSKYFVSTKQYAPSVYPDFTTGPAYLLTKDVVRDLYKHALNLTYLKLEDVFTTGIVAQAINVKRVHVNEFLNKRILFNICNIKKSISIHMVKYHEQFDLWKKLLDGRSKCK